MITKTVATGILKRALTIMEIRNILAHNGDHLHPPRWWEMGEQGYTVVFEFEGETIIVMNMLEDTHPALSVVVYPDFLEERLSLAIKEGEQQLKKAYNALVRIGLKR